MDLENKMNSISISDHQPTPDQQQKTPTTELFAELNNQLDSDDGPETTEIESLCLNCGSEKGTTKLLLTSIPFYKEVVLMSFSCPNCGWENNELQPAGKIAERGVRIVVK